MTHDGPPHDVFLPQMTSGQRDWTQTPVPLLTSRVNCMDHPRIQPHPQKYLPRWQPFCKECLGGSQGRRQGGWGGCPPHQKKKRRERGERKRGRKRNQKTKEVEPIIPRTCGHGSLVAPRPQAAPGPPNVMASAFVVMCQPPLSQNPAYAPGYRIISWFVAQPKKKQKETKNFIWCLSQDTKAAFCHGVLLYLVMLYLQSTYFMWGMKQKLKSRQDCLRACKETYIL